MQVLTPGSVRFSCREFWAFNADSRELYVKKAHPAKKTIIVC